MGRRRFYLWGRVTNEATHPHLKRLIKYKEEVYTRAQLVELIATQDVFVEYGQIEGWRWTTEGVSTEAANEFFEAFPEAVRRGRHRSIIFKQLEVGDTVIVKLPDGTYKLYTAVEIAEDTI